MHKPYFWDNPERLVAVVFVFHQLSERDRTIVPQWSLRLLPFLERLASRRSDLAYIKRARKVWQRH